MFHKPKCVQSFKQAVPGPAGLLPDLQILSALIKSLEEDAIQGPDLSSIWKEMGKSSGSPLKGISFADVPEDGLLIDGSKWSHLEFVEKKALNYTPARKVQNLNNHVDQDFIFMIGLKCFLHS